jgi:FKBP-type peptidyl-prolyl cis-trans isomerase
MDNPIAPLDRSSLNPGSNRVKQPQGSEKEKERKKFSEELEEELDEEKKKRDRVEITSAELQAENAQDGNERSSEVHGEPDKPVQHHVDLTA